MVANRFDATQGRSSGMVVNAITKSGTNTFAGTVGGYFRNDKFNAEDFVAKRVLPYSNQQTSGTFGGPILRDRLHFFGTYEYEREPKTFVYAGPYPAFNMDLSFQNTGHKPLGRVDWQITPQMRLSSRASFYIATFYEGGGSTVHPSNMGQRGRNTSQYTGSVTNVISNRSVNEIKGGATYYERQDQSATITWKGQRPLPYNPVLNGGTVTATLRGYSIGTSPLNIIQNTMSVRDDFTTSYEMAGRHDVKMGGEYFRFFNDFRWCLRCMGVIDALGAGAAPSNAELAAMFPVWNDASTWNVAPLLPITRFVQHSLTSTEHTYDVTRNLFSAWVQDDWAASDRLTLNLGVRWDWDSNGNSESLEFRPWLPGDLSPPPANFAPRVGMNFKLDDRTVIRGGYGLFFAFQPNDGVQQSQGYLCSTEANYCARFENQITPDGSANFLPNWFGPGASREGEWGGPKPSGLDAVARACDVNRSAPGCVYRSLTQEINYPGRPPQFAHQAGVGMQRQLADSMAFEANFNYTGGRREEVPVNGNLSYNPATGANNSFSTVALRPFPDWGIVNFEWLAGRSNYYGSDFTLTKRYSDNWQMSGSYTLAYFKDSNPRREQWFIGSDGLVDHRAIDFPLAADMGEDYSYAESDQRHRFTANGIWDIGRGLQMSGVYFYGSGERRGVNTGVDRRNEGSSSEQRLRADGSIVPRNTLVGQPIHRVDMRLQQRIPVGGVRLDGMLEIFNVFNHANYGSYTTNESNALFGQPSFNSNIAYWPRVLQLGLRLAF